MVAARYEGLFVAAGCAAALSIGRRYLAAAAVLVASLVPVTIVGIWNVSHGWFFLPASIMMKQTVLPGARGGNVVEVLIGSIGQAQPPAAFLVMLLGAVLLVIFTRVRGSRPAGEPLLIAFVVAAVLHLGLAKFGWLFRYESYLMALGVVALGVTLCKGAEPEGAGARMLPPLSGAPLMVASLLAVLLVPDRTLASHVLVGNVASHIDRQQMKIAEFVDRFYKSRPVALNDIGAVSYASDARVVDLMGLGSLEAATLRRRGDFDAAHIDAWLEREQAGVAIVYDAWFQGDQAFQRSWTLAGAWRTESSDEAESLVSFYGRDGERARLLRDQLKAFTSSVPASTEVTLAGSYNTGADRQDVSPKRKEE
jgi:hypothetical protein